MGQYCAKNINILRLNIGPIRAQFKLSVLKWFHHLTCVRKLCSYANKAYLQFEKKSIFFQVEKYVFLSRKSEEENCVKKFFSRKKKSGNVFLSRKSEEENCERKKI